MSGWRLVGTDRSPHGSSCSCAYSRLPLQPRSSSAALKSPYIIRARSCAGCSHDAAPKYGVPRGISTSQGTTSWWAARGHFGCIALVRGARFSSLCCWVSSAFLDVVLPWPSLATSDVPAYRETSRNMVANATARRWSPLAFSCDAVSRSDGVCLVLTRFCLFFGFLDHDGPRPPPHSAGAVFQRQVFSWFLLFATWAFGRAWEGAAFRSSLFVFFSSKTIAAQFFSWLWVLSS